MRKTNSLTLSCAALAVVNVFLSPSVQAGNLAPMVVTPTRSAETVDAVSASVQVITRQEIKRSPSRSLAGLLQDQPGLTLANEGGLGKQTSLFMRGANSNQTLVLVDGVKINSADSGLAQIEDLPLSMIDHIEIVKGPRSGLYGSEAMGGVIQIFTRRGNGSSRAQTEITAGSQQTERLSQFLSGGGNGTQWSLSGSMLNTAGQNAQLDAQPDKDGFNQKSLSGSIQSILGQRWTLGANVLHSNGDNDYDNASDRDYSQNPPSLNKNDRQWDRYAQDTGRVYADYAASDSLTVKLQVGLGREDTDNYLNAQPTYRFVTHHQQYLVKVDQMLTETQRLTLALERDYDKVAGTTDYTRDSRYDNAVFGQWLLTGTHWHGQASLRLDDNQAFGRKTTGSASVGYVVNDWLQPYASYGTAFLAPTFTDLYYPGYSNPNLKPETSATGEVGLKGASKNLSYSLSLFSTHFADLIALNSKSIPVNINSAQSRGGEASLTYVWEQWRLGSSLTYVLAKNRDSGLELLRRPKWSGRFSLGRTVGKFYVQGSLRSQDGSADNYFDPVSYASSRVRLPGFTLVDASIVYHPAPKWMLKLSGSNLLDKNYQTVYDYPGEGRVILGTVRYSY